MAKGEVKIHELFSNHNGLHSSDLSDLSDPEPPSDSMEDSVEFRLLMAYAKRRRPQTESPPPPPTGPLHVNGGTSSSQTPAKPEKEEKKRKGKPWKRFRKMFSCIKPQTMDEGPRDGEAMGGEPMDGKPPCTLSQMHSGLEDRCGDSGDSNNEIDKLAEIASRLTGIADEIPFTRPELETDSGDDPNVEKMIGLLLRETGDRLNEKELKDASLARELFLNYTFFETLMNTLLAKMGLTSPSPDSLGPKASPKTQIAVTCEVTSRLSAVNSLPSNRLLDHGARYLQHYYSPWAQQQGGYEDAFYSDDEEEDTQ